MGNNYDTINNIKCGVYPFNPDAIDCSIGVADVDGSDKKVMMTIMTRSLGKHQKV